MSALRLGVRRLLRSVGYDFHALPVKGLTLRDLTFDLPILVPHAEARIIDVGANAGQTIDLLQRSLDRPRIISFEPNPVLVEPLRRKYEPLGVVVEGSAVGSECGTTSLIVCENDELSSILRMDQVEENPFQTAPNVGRVTVPLTTLDAYLDSKQITRVDVLKTDTQGYELEVLKGASRTLETRGVEIVLVEVMFIRMYEQQCSLSDIAQLLSWHGFGLLTFYETVRRQGCIRWVTACFRKLRPEP